MANALHSRFGDFDFSRARWLIEIFDEACRVLPSVPTDAEREILATGIVRAARLYDWDRNKLREAGLAYLRGSAQNKEH